MKNNINVYNINGRMAFNKIGCIELFKKEYLKDKFKVIEDIKNTQLFTIDELIDLKKRLN